MADKSLNSVADRGLPHNAEAERALIGCLLLDSQYCDVVEISPAVFFTDAHRILCTHLLAIHDGGIRVDVAVLVDRLKRFEHYEQAGGAHYLAECMQAAPIAANARYYADIVRALARQRRCIQESLDFAIAVQSARDPKELDAAIDRHAQVIDELDDAESLAADVTPPSMKQTALVIVERSRSDRGSGGLLMGIPGMDALVGGLQGGQCITIAARPGCGKTQMASHIAISALEQGVGVLFVSLEMSGGELNLRALANRSQINAFTMQQGNLTGLQQDRVLDAGNELDRLPLVIDDRPTQTVEQIGRRARRLRRQGKLGLVVIDYLQLIEPSDHRQPRAEQVARMSRGLKRLAKQLNVPIVACAQLNRSADNSRPRLAHLRESGAIEQDSDVVTFLHTETPGSEKLLLIVEKNRSGPVGDVEVNWNRGTATFSERSNAWDVDQY